MLFSNIRKLLLKKQEKPKLKDYLALEIGEDTIKGAVWHDDEKISVKETVKSKTVEEVISKIKEKGYEVEETVFGFPSYYLSGDEIKEKYLNELKKITSQNSLTPLGFVVISEAIAHLLKVQEEAPQSAIFIAVSKEKLIISLFRGGKSKKIEQVERTEKLFGDFDKALDKFSDEEVLPSKIILYDGAEDLELVRDELLSYPWQRNSKFLHVPKIIALPWDFSIKAIVEAGVSEMSKKDVKMMTGPITEETPEEKTDEELAKKEESAVFVTEEEKKETDDDSLGFVAEKDVAEEKEAVTEKPAKENLEIHIEKEKVLETSSEIIPEKGLPEKEIEEKQSHFQVNRVQRKFDIKSSAFSLFSRFHFPKMNFRFLRLKGIAILILLLIVLGGIIVSTVYLYPKAEIKLIAQPEVVDQKMDISLNTAIVSADLDNKEIPGKVYSAEVSGEKTRETTGKKTIGDKAAGKITIYNKTSSSKTFVKGTVITGSSSLKFTLDEEVKAASASDTGTSLEYGKVDANVTAAKIGPDGNLKKDSDFQIDDYPTSSYLGRNDNDFSGGTEREIDVVSQDDQDGLLKDLTDELRSDAKGKLQLEVTGDERLLDESIKENIVDKTFDKDVGDESDNLSLSLTIEFSATVYKQSDLDKFLEQYISGQMPKDFVFDKDKSYFNVTETDVAEDGSVSFKADYHAYLVPTIDLNEFKKEIAGKSISFFEGKAKELEDKSIIGYEINYSRRFPLIGNRLPLLSQNIEVKIVPY